MTETHYINGQKIVYNPERKLVKTTIETPFMSAGKQMLWDLTKYGTCGIGLNLKIIELVLKTNSTLIVYVLSTPQGPIEKDYWIHADKLKQYLTLYNNDYKIRNTILKIIPWKLFNTHAPIIPTKNNLITS